MGGALGLGMGLGLGLGLGLVGPHAGGKTMSGEHEG